MCVMSTKFNLCVFATVAVISVLPAEVNAASGSVPNDGGSARSSNILSSGSEVEAVSAGVAAKFRGNSMIRYLGRGDQASRFAIDAVGNAYRYSAAFSQEPVVRYLEDLPVGSTNWTPTGARIDQVGDENLLPRDRKVSISDLSGGKNQAGFVYLTNDGRAPSAFFCTVFSGDQKWGAECQLFRGLKSGQIEIARESGDVYINNDQGVFRSSPNNFPGTRVRIGEPAGRIYAGANTIYATDKSTGDVYKHEGNHWVKISGPVDALAVSMDGVLFKTVSTLVYQYFGSVRGWRQIGQISAASKLLLAVGKSSDLYAYDSDGGEIHRYSGIPGEWDKFYGGPIAEKVVASENAIMFRTGGAYASTSLVTISHPRDVRGSDE